MSSTPDEPDLVALAALSRTVAPRPLTRIAIFDDALGATATAGLLDRLAESEPSFVRNDAPGRSVSVLRTAPEWSVPFADHVIEHAAELLAPFGVTPDEVVVPALADVAVARFGHADFFGPHHDNSAGEAEIPSELRARRVTIAYHLFCEPQRFTGGDLHFLDPAILGDDDSTHPFTTVACRNDGIVAFDSSARHEVRTVNLPGDAFIDGRFSLVTHFRARID